jgi:hypothetical protein
MSSTVTLWRPTGQAELNLVAQSGWKKWPPRLPEQPIFYPVLNRHYATRITREWNVPQGGVGYVTSFEVNRAFLDGYQVQKVGGKDILEYWIPAEELEKLNANIVGAIMEVSEYRGPIADTEFVSAEGQIGHGFPKAWSAYLKQCSWLRKGWLSENCYLRLLRPSESLETLVAWQPTKTHPGIFIIGDDGASEHLAVDLRESNPPVLSVNQVSRVWSDAIPQAESLDAFLTQVESSSFEFKL